jgi:hypothetical protein
MPICVPILVFPLPALKQIDTDAPLSCVFVVGTWQGLDYWREHMLAD